ncbi:hypothetical protein AGMMS49990_09420 [Endomicrobiia bacterium]|nr:hypothetical protein AGMMS49990_09370 [Endomicrobiia bacterium]GHT52714.1 hypothetical protein AGMMS49990_09420 [Endomicrobiia bacterium]
MKIEKEEPSALEDQNPLKALSVTDGICFLVDKIKYWRHK